MPITTLVPGQLTVCMYSYFFPIAYKNSCGGIVGLDRSFLSDFAQSVELELSIIDKPFEKIWTLPGAGLCDIAAAGLTRRADRQAGPGGSWSDPYIDVERSLIVRSADKPLFDHYQTLKGKKIVVARGTVAESDAKQRYPHCTILFTDEVAPEVLNRSEFIVKTLIAKHHVDGLANGTLSNQFLCKAFNDYVPGGLAQADTHALSGEPETFNFVTRDRSQNLLNELNRFIKNNKQNYVSNHFSHAP